MMISKKWRRIAEMYRRFSEIKRVSGAPPHVVAIWDAYDASRDFSEDAAREAYCVETFGEEFSIRRVDGKINGYIEGKQVDGFNHH